MHHLASAELWAEVERLGRKGPKKAAIAYVSTERRLKFGEGDVLVVDASDAAIKGGETSADVLGRALQRGAKLYSVPGLHAKGMILDGTAVIGSANLSASSQTALVEAALITKSPGVVAMLASFVERLKTTADEIDERFVARIARLPVKRNVRRPVRGGRRIRLGKSVTWLVSFDEADFNSPEERRVIAAARKEAEDLKSSRSSSLGRYFTENHTVFRNLVKPGDKIVSIVNGSRRTHVCVHEPVLLRKDIGRRTWLFTEEPSGKPFLKWGTFKGLLREAGLQARVTRHSERRIPERVSESLHALWLALPRRGR